MRFPLAGWAWPPGPRVSAAHNSGVDGRGDGREKGPMQAASGFQRDKTRPATRLGGPPGTKLSQQAALAGPPGTKLSQQAPKRRFRPTFRMQGELFTASATNNPSRENFIPHAGPLPVQNSPSKRPWQAHPVQNSPSEPQNADFGPFCASRENFVPFPPPTRQAGRTLSRTQSHFRYKTLPASPKTPISAHFSHAGRTFYRFRHQHDEQGEKSHAPTLHRTPTTCRSPNFACNSIA